MGLMQKEIEKEKLLFLIEFFSRYISPYEVSGIRNCLPKNPNDGISILL